MTVEEAKVAKQVKSDNEDYLIVAVKNIIVQLPRDPYEREGISPFESIQSHCKINCIVLKVVVIVILIVIFTFNHFSG